MAAITLDFEVATAIPPAKIFKAFVLESHIFITKILPDVVKSVTLEQGDGGAGTIKIVNFCAGSQFKLVKERIDALDKENFTLAYTVIEGDLLTNIFEKVSCELKFEATSDGGSICKRSSKYYTVGNIEINEEQKKIEIEKAKELFTGILKAFEAFLLANPDV